MLNHKHILKLIFTAALPLVLANCSGSSMGQSAADNTAGSDFQVATTPPPRPPVNDILRIDYHSWGGYPGPNGKIYTDLQINLEPSGAVSARYETASCASKMNISREEFDELVRLIGYSAYFIGAGSGAPDMPTRTVALSNLKPTGAAPVPYHLSEDGTSKGERVLTDGLKVSEKINALIQRLQHACSVTCLPK